MIRFIQRNKFKASYVIITLVNLLQKKGKTVMRSKKRFAIVMLCVAASIGSVACRKTEVEESKMESSIEMVEDNSTNSEQPISELVGEYMDENNEVGLIVEWENDSYHIEISIFRLTSIDDGVGTLEGDKIVFTATDASGSPIGGEIVKTDVGADVIFTDSTWEYIQNGDTFRYYNK